MRGGFRTYRDRRIDILSEDNALEFNDKEVDKLLDILQHSLQSLTGDGVVFLRADLARQTLAKSEVADDLSSSGDTKSYPGQAEDVGNDRDVTSSEDGQDDGAIADSGGARVLPAEEVVEERVVVGEFLAGGSLGMGNSARVGEAGELILGLVGLGAGLIGYGTVVKSLHYLRVGDGFHGGGLLVRSGGGLGGLV